MKSIMSLKVLKVVLIISIITIFVSCSNKFSDYHTITLNYDVNYLDTESAYNIDNIVFKPIKDFIMLPENYLNEFKLNHQSEINEYFIESPLIVYADSLSQMLIISNLSSNILSNNDLFLNSLEYYKNIYQDNVLRALPFRYNKYLFNQFVISYGDNILVKSIFTNLKNNKSQNVFMVDYLLLRDNFAEKMLSVESSIASIGQSEN